MVVAGSKAMEIHREGRKHAKRRHKDAYQEMVGHICRRRRPLLGKNITGRR